jgi:rSAM/selenodomain-associated transferase 2
MLSIIIPTLNAAPALKDCLAIVSGAGEIVVVDGGSLDEGPALARAAGARLVVAPKGRGTQLAAGAAAACGDWLLFLHADCWPRRGWREAVEAHIAGFPAMAACFRFCLDDSAWQARAMERGVALRVSMLGLPYGDQGLLVPRALYQQVGGYRPLPLMEDVDIIRRIGRKRLRLLDADALTSAERWRRDGWLRRSGRNLLCLALFQAGLSPERIARLYD